MNMFSKIEHKTFSPFVMDFYLNLWKLKQNVNFRNLIQRLDQSVFFRVMQVIQTFRANIFFTLQTIQKFVNVKSTRYFVFSPSPRPNAVETFVGIWEEN